MSEQLILMPGAGAAPLDDEPFAGAHEDRVAALLVAAEEGGDRHAERCREHLQRRERRRGQAVLDLRQHAGRELCRGGEVGDREAKLVRKARTSRPIETSRRFSRAPPTWCGFCSEGFGGFAGRFNRRSWSMCHGGAIAPSRTGCPRLRKPYRPGCRGVHTSEDAAPGTASFCAQAGRPSDGS